VLVLADLQHGTNIGVDSFGKEVDDWLRIILLLDIFPTFLVARVRFVRDGSGIDRLLFSREIGTTEGSHNAGIVDYKSIKEWLEG
jgi:hypothetical protein